jgi:signal transduction histidine kinase
MQQAGPTCGSKDPERLRVETVITTLAAVHGESENLAEVAHDARNMVAALGLYCDLLEEPGGLTAGFAHYGGELRLVAMASRRLVEKLVTLDRLGTPDSGPFSSAPAGLALAAAAERRNPGQERWDPLPPLPIENLAAALAASQSLLAALAGPKVSLRIDAEGGARPIHLNGVDLTRVLVNLVKNAAEAMPGGGHIQMRLRDMPTEGGEGGRVSLMVEDDGPGIPKLALDRIFEAGYSTHPRSIGENGWPAAHRGLGLSITQSIVEAGGGVCSRRESGTGGGAL